MNDDEIKKAAKNSLQLESVIGRRVMEGGAFVGAIGSVLGVVVWEFVGGFLALGSCLWFY